MTDQENIAFQKNLERACSDSTRGSAFNQKEDRFRLAVMKKSFQRSETMEQNAQRLLIPGVVQGQAG